MVAAGIAVVKTGSTVHADAMSAVADRLGAVGAVAVAVVLAGVTLAVLAFLRFPLFSASPSSLGPSRLLPPFISSSIELEVIKCAEGNEGVHTK